MDGSTIGRRTSTRRARVANYEWQRTVEQVESAKSKAKTSAAPIPAPRYILSRTKAVEREANGLLAAIRKEGGGTSSERPVTERVNAGQMDETAETESVAVKQTAERAFEGTANEKPAEIDAFPIPTLRNSVSRSKAEEREVTGQLAAGCEELAGELTALKQIAEVAICEELIMKTLT
jgi:hypothetical protein